MPKYLLQGTYTQEGMTGLLKEGGSSRQSSVQDIIHNLGGSVESYYFCLGMTDFVVICALPDRKHALALSMAVQATGGINVSITALIEPKEIDEATKIRVGFRAPGAN